jgi:archaemetzincin
MIYLMTAEDTESLINFRDIAENVEKDLGFPVRKLPIRLPLDQSSYDPKRKQYHSTSLLKEFLRNFPPDALKAIGIVPFDLFIPILTFVFGEAQLDGKVAIVSTARLGQAFYGLPSNQRLLDRRLIKEIKHELGHTFGLLHCAERSCIMSLAANISDVDLRGLTYCKACKAMLRRR